MFNNQSRIPFSIAAVALVSAFIISTETSFGESNLGKLEGSWMGTVTATNPPLGSFTNLITFTPKGGVVESRRLYVSESPVGPILETPGHGEWIKIGDREFQVKFVFLLEGASDNQISPGIPLGTDNVSLRIQLNKSGTELNGTFESNVKDPHGNIIFTAIGTYSATPIHAEP